MLELGTSSELRVQALRPGDTIVCSYIVWHMTYDICIPRSTTSRFCTPVLQYMFQSKLQTMMMLLYLVVSSLHSTLESTHLTGMGLLNSIIPYVGYASPPLGEVHWTPNLVNLIETVKGCMVWIGSWWMLFATELFKDFFRIFIIFSGNSPDYGDFAITADQHLHQLIWKWVQHPCSSFLQTCMQNPRGFLDQSQLKIQKQYKLSSSTAEWSVEWDDHITIHHEACCDYYDHRHPTITLETTLQKQPPFWIWGQWTRPAMLQASPQTRQRTWNWKDESKLSFGCCNKSNLRSPWSEWAQTHAF